MASKLLQLEERLVKVEARRSMPGALTIMAPSEGTAPSHTNTGIIVDRLAALEDAAEVGTAWGIEGLICRTSSGVAHNNGSLLCSVVIMYAETLLLGHTW